jgi:hypothetical protein
LSTEASEEDLRKGAKGKILKGKARKGLTNEAILDLSVSGKRAAK